MDLTNLPITSNTLSIMLGCFFLVIAVIQFARLLKLSMKGITVSATIKDLIEKRNTHGPPVYFPLLEYRTEKGEIITRRSYVGKDRLHQQKIGDTVTVVYNPDKPGQFLLDKGMDKYWKAIGSVIAGVVFIAAGFLQLF